MKILSIYRDCGPSFVFNGWAKVFKALGHDVTFWPIDYKKPAFDAFHEGKPDLFIGTTFDLDAATLKCITNRPELKVILYCSAWGDLVKNVDTKKYPLLVAGDEEKKKVELLQKTGQLKFVFLHYPETWVDRTLGGWKSIGVKPVGILNAADLYDYYRGTPRDEYKCDVAFVGGYWGYKARNLDKYLLPLSFEQKYTMRVFGNQPWPIPEYLGQIETKDVKDLFASARVSPNISEPHSTDFGFDIIERIFKVPSSKGCLISDYVEGIKDIFDNPPPMFTSYSEFLDLMDLYTTNDKIRGVNIDILHDQVIEHHTYFDRIAQVFTELQMDSEANKCAQLKESFLCQSHGTSC